MDDTEICDGLTITNNNGVVLEPYEGHEFESLDTAKTFYNTYARRTGFSTRVSSSRRSKKDGKIIQRYFVCANEGFRNPNDTRSTNVKRPRVITRVGCKATMSVKAANDGRWVVNGFVKEHNHDLVAVDLVHCLRSHRMISGVDKILIDRLHSSGLGPRKIMAALVDEYGGVEKVGFTEIDCKNYVRNLRVRSRSRVKDDCDFRDFQFVVDHLRRLKDQSSDFYYCLKGVNVFWFDAKMRLNYGFFGDSVRFDAAFRSCRYRLPFVSVTGVDHHGQPVLFGCAFLGDESEESFVWLFECFLEGMLGKGVPVSITTDYDETIREAVVKVFPESRHRFCKWNLFKKCQEKLSHVMVKYPSFEADFHKCVNFCESVDEFESCWLSFLDKYELQDDEWIQSVYGFRKQLVPVYLRDSFFAEMPSAQCSDSVNSYFDGYVNDNTSLNQFFQLYEKAIESRNEREVKADYETMNVPAVLRTPSPMEKQVSTLYTKKIFSRFQEELVGTLTLMAMKGEEDDEAITYRVTKYGEDHRCFNVRFNVLDMKASCSCQMFEFSGLLCRHILVVFRVTNILTLPSHYILKRWTRNAKSSVILDDESRGVKPSDLDSHIVRYSNLRHEALKFVDEGAGTLETYDVAMVALQEASEKVTEASKSGGRACNESTISEGDSRNTASEDNCVNSNEEVSEDLLDKKIRELNEELDLANQKCEFYRSNLLSALKDIEDHEQQLALKVHNVKLSLKDGT